MIQSRAKKVLLQKSKSACQPATAGRETSYNSGPLNVIQALYTYQIDIYR